MSFQIAIETKVAGPGNQMGEALHCAWQGDAILGVSCGLRHRLPCLLRGP